MATPSLSVIIPIVERGDELPEVYDDYVSGLKNCQLDFEILLVLDQQDEQIETYVDQIVLKHAWSKSIKLTRSYGDSTALVTGLSSCRGDDILILPPFPQIEGTEIPRILEKLKDCDLVVAERIRRTESRLNRIQSALYNGMTAPPANAGPTMNATASIAARADKK